MTVFYHGVKAELNLTIRDSLFPDWRASQSKVKIKIKEKEMEVEASDLKIYAELRN